MSRDHRHLTIRGLALHAQRMGKVFAAPATWGRLIRQRGWLRPRARIHPATPKEGVRATKPNEYWHIDVTVIRLLDGTRVYLHAVIDNFSRRILAWKLAARLEPQSTCAILSAAGAHLDSNAATVVADSGVENVNGEVDALLSVGQLRRVLAQVEVTFSNSMIEAWWRSLKHNWLFLNTLETFAAVERLVAFYCVLPVLSFRHESLLARVSLRSLGELQFRLGQNTTLSNTTLSCPTPHFAARLPTRCTSRSAPRFPRTSPSLIAPLV